MHGRSLLIRINPDGPSTCGITDPILMISKDQLPIDEHVGFELEESDLEDIDAIRVILFGRIFTLREINYLP